MGNRVPWSRNPLSLDMGWKEDWVYVFKQFFQSRNPLSLDMGWKDGMNIEEINHQTGRNPLSLDMGWKDSVAFWWSWYTRESQSAFAGYGLKRSEADKIQKRLIRSQSAFAGYGLKREADKTQRVAKLVAIRFRWIWVEKGYIRVLELLRHKSQSAFAGYGLKR